MRNTLRFVLGDELVEIASCDPTLTLLDWLRLERRMTGSKEGCAEGDCGACTVVIGRLDRGVLRYEAINACIRFLPTLDGCHLLTVEHLRGEHGALHPVQQAMVDCHGSQCGFCTPGIVMSLFALWLNEDAPSVSRIEDALAGNLCRCTGYEPIVAAAQQMYRLGHRDGFGTRRDAMQAKLQALADAETLSLGGSEGRFLAPTSVEALADLVIAHPRATLVAGATDVGLWVTKGMRRLDPVIFLGRIAAMRAIEDRGDHLRIGAMATHADVRPALAALSPQLDELMRRFGGEQVRNAGTIGGNIANGSPIGDLPPVLIALGATLVLARAHPSRSPHPEEAASAAVSKDDPERAGASFETKPAASPQDEGGWGLSRREIPLEDFFIDYRKQDRREGEFVEAVMLPKPEPGALLHVSKISKRFDEDISAVCGAFLLRLGEDGLIAEARLAYGGMAGIPKRGAVAEAALVGRAWADAAVDAAIAALPADFTPLSDMRASAGYRLSVAGNLLRRFLIETTQPRTQTRVAGLLAEAVHG